MTVYPSNLDVMEFMIVMIDQMSIVVVSIKGLEAKLLMSHVLNIYRKCLRTWHINWTFICILLKICQKVLLSLSFILNF